MKTVVNTQQVAHLWANNSQEHARNAQGNLYFDGAIIYSYGSHWPLAVHSGFTDARGRGIVFTNGGRYGNTTDRHVRHVAGALRGHPLTVVAVPLGAGASGLSADAARDLARGDAATLVDVIAALGDKARADYADALRRRDEWRAARDLDAMRDAFASAQSLAALGKNATERAKLTRVAGALPDSVPAQWKDADGRPLDYLCSVILADARKLAKIETAAAGLVDAIKETRAQWKRARGADDNATRASMARDAAKYRARADKLAKVAGAAVPRGVPSLSTIEAAATKHGHAAAIDTARHDAGRLRDMVQVYGTLGARMTGLDAAAASRARSTLARGGRAESGDHINSLAHFLDAVRRIPAGDATAGTIRDVRAAMEAPSATIARDAAAAWSDLQEAAADAIAELSPLAARVARMGARADAEERGADLVESVRCAAPADADAPTIRAATKAADMYAAALVDLADAGGDADGLPAPMPADARAALDARIERATVYGLLQTARVAPDVLADNVTRARSAIARGHVLSAQRVTLEPARMLASAERALVDARTRADALPVDADLDAAMLAARVALQPAAAAVSAIVDEARAALESMLRIHGTHGALDEACWRAGDTYATRPSHRVAFRLTADGDTVESSLGARVSLSAARRLWALIRSCVASGKSRAWDYGTGPRVGSFHLESIAADGRTKVGCHDISADEARTFARAMAWPPFGAATEADALPSLDSAAVQS